MKRMIIMAAVAFAALATPAMAQSKKANKDVRTEAGVSDNDKQQNKRRKDPKKRTARLAEKLNFSDAQKAQLSALNQKYPGTDFDRKAYHQEFKAIMTDAQKQQLAEIRAKHKAKKGQRGEKKKA